MSLLSMASVGVARDHAEADQPLTGAAIVPRIPAAAVIGGAGQPAFAGPAATNPPGQTAGQPDGVEETSAGGVAGFGQLLVAQIPSEALLAYTTLLALFTAGGVGYTTGRWVLYGAAVVVCAAVVLGGYFAKRDYGFDDTHAAVAAGTAPAPVTTNGAPAPTAPGAKLHLPYMPVLAAVASMAIYGLAVPGSPLQFEMPGTTFAIVAGCLAVGGGVMMSIFAPFLGKGNEAKVAAKQP
jgi:hypothetical protein